VTQLSSDFEAIVELPAAEIEKICAGEVVERPLSVVKELIENALDAGATRITIELEDGGRQGITVADNGQGIAFSELPLALARHCTSKIRLLDDLYSLRTLGFRGEALASIAAVSRVSLTSKRADEDIGGRVEASGGALLSHSHIHFQGGTEVEVRDLFFNTPARLKFLKSQQAETSQITALVNTYALAYPEVQWNLATGDRTLLSTEGDGDLLGVLAGLVKLAPEALVAIDFEFPPSAVHGFVSTPEYHLHNRSRQWYFVNRRPVANKLLYKTVDDAVRENLSTGKFPLGAFFLELPPEELDVNIHPTKSEVNFAQPQGVYSLLGTAVRRALGESTAIRQRQMTRGLAAMVSPSSSQAAKSHTSNAESQADSDKGSSPGAIPPDQAEQPLALLEFAEQSAGPVIWRTETHSRGSAASEYSDQDPWIEQLPDAALSAAVLAQQEKPGSIAISQVANSYLVVVTREEVLLIDQHAAHERVLFEQLYPALHDVAAQPVASQRLLFPLMVPLNAAEATLAERCISALANLGFQCKLGAGSTLIVGTVPLVLGKRVTAELLQAMFSDLAETDLSSTFEEQLKQLASSLACRAAVKANQVLHPTEREELVRLILAQLDSLTCPHGRPVVKRLGTSELARLFLR